ncbi:hypothetical protein NM208_g5081 [Fusarium decemcellulare]|uniref:Uncharacterized protein n=2 Tax=Fusarium decemcellulare TaxID=57161 RepID=A0ACC1SIC2_9HYPO|nr:hypothetical protein NM208_g5679 [Fusarium decemcellulare]KAJ3540399.1 hypothetical protein NM208_g5081 [Fusarium decemcellulare]
MAATQKIAVQRMAQQLLVQIPADDWTGVTSVAERRKLQNRLNKRRQYQRNRIQRQIMQVVSNATDQAGQSTSPTTSAPQASPDVMVEVIRQTCEVFGSPDISQTVFTLASKAYGDYVLNAPRLSQLPFLITVNINIAMAKNATRMGFKREILCLEDSISPFNYSGPSQLPASFPQSLEPTSIQQNVLHHPWLDVFPFPKFRDNVIYAVAANLMDDDDLCADISEINYDNVERPCLIVWGESWDPNGWEASVLFLRKWGWLLRGCPEIIEATNRWRQSRGERLLHWHDI